MMELKTDNEKFIDRGYKIINELQEKLNDGDFQMKELKRQKDMLDLEEAIGYKNIELSLEEKMKVFKKTFDELEKIKDYYLNTYKENVDINKSYDILLEKYNTLLTERTVNRCNCSKELKTVKDQLKAAIDKCKKLEAANIDKWNIINRLKDLIDGVEENSNNHGTYLEY